MTGVARRLSKLGICSRTEAARWVLAGRVRVDGRLVRDPETPTSEVSRIEVDGRPLQLPERVYLMLNKPRGLLTTAQDEQARDTVYRCLDGLDLPWLAPVGRLDKASEGLLLLSNDTQWAARLADPQHGVSKTYHVQVKAIPTPEQLQHLQRGVIESGELLTARTVRLLRSGQRNAWLEIVLEQGRNRQIRRMLATMQLSTLRLIRVAIGALVLGDLAKGAVRRLEPADFDALGVAPQ